LSDTTREKTAKLFEPDSLISPNLSGQPLSIRVSSNSYFTAFQLLVFFASFLLYIDKDFWAIPILIFGFIVLPFLALTDRICFDGKRLLRKGLLPGIWANLNSFHYRLKLTDVEQVETQAFRALKRGGNVFYRYRTSFSGKNLRFVIVSGGEEYRQMIRAILPLLPENVLDNRSLELRDYLSEPKEVLMKAQFANIPSAEVLEDSVKNFQRCKNGSPRENILNSDEKAEYLRRLANELRLSGYLLQALEAFRRALILKPQDGWLLFEFARCLNSFAGAERNKTLQRKSLALLRLAEKRARDDSELLARLGESYFQFGELKRAQKVFQKSLEEFEESFRSVRGMAEIAIREGKIAHVIHNFLRANRLAETRALCRWTKNEADYFSNLNNNQEYMQMELGRISLLETLERVKKVLLRIGLLGLPVIILGLILNDSLTTNTGWAISITAFLIWIGAILIINAFSSRIPFELVENED
jgi:tetratricopeptide (TPR) repeat protein